MNNPTVLKWEAPEVPEGAPEALEHRYHLPGLVARVLAARGWEPGPAMATFLDDAAVPPPDPLALVGVERAAGRLWEAIDAGQGITICGDYDADGVTGTALLVDVLRAAGAKVDWYLPHRYYDGYGLNAEVLEGMVARGTRVIVTVDNGTTSMAELALAYAMDIAAIVTDHHLPGPQLPATHTIVNPHLMEDAGPFAPLAGVGVAYTLARGLAALRPAAGLAPVLERQLDLVALGTIGDLAPLSGENRRLVRAGLAQLATRSRLGLQLLAKSVKVELGGPGAAEAIAHRLIPRLNAAGRMAHPTLALELLLAETEPEARALIEKLDQLNQKRRLLTEATEERCAELLADQPPRGSIALSQVGWHHGVTGIVAARLAERHNCPVLLFAPDGSGWRASGRSIPGFDLHAVLDELAPYLDRYGGHAAAVGLTLSYYNLEPFIEAFHAAVARRRGEQPPDPVVWQVDLEVPLDELTYQSVAGLACLEPTGMDNPNARLAARGLRVVRQGVRGPAGQHLWLELAANGGERTIEAIGFGMGGRHPLGERVDAVFTPVAERWHGKQRLQLRLAAIDNSLA